jgi:hypothetical protein
MENPFSTGDDEKLQLLQKIPTCFSGKIGMPGKVAKYYGNAWKVYGRVMISTSSWKIGMLIGLY